MLKVVFGAGGFRTKDQQSGARAAQDVLASDGLRLIVPLGKRTWLASPKDLDMVVVRRLDTSERTRAGSPESAAARALAGLRLPGLVPVLGTHTSEGAVWLVSERDHGVPLRRLLRVTRLTPTQAAVLAADVLRAFESLRAVGLSVGQVDQDDVRVGTAGTSRLTPWVAQNPLTTDDDLPVAAAEETIAGPDQGEAGASALLGVLAQAPRQPGSDALPAAKAPVGSADLFVALEGLDLGRLRSEGYGAMAEKLDAAVGGRERIAQVRQELAALVTAVKRGEAAALRDPSDVVPPALAAVPWRIRDHTRETLRTGWSRSWQVLVALAALLVVVVLEVVFVGHDIRRDLGLVRQPARPLRSTVASPTGRPPLPLPDFGPGSAGRVDGVNARMLRACVAGGRCQVIVLVTVQPAGTPTRVQWRFAVVDRCTNTTRVSRLAGDAALPPRAEHVYGLATVDLPASRSIAVVAVTTRPAVAAAAPLLVPAAGGRC